nr:hypothetical protein [Tanacetum cinerariifolium]
MLSVTAHNPIVTTVTKTASKEKTPKEADAALKANILYFCEEHYEDILLVIMDKIRREKRKEVHARLDFEENTMKNRRVREDSQNSSAGTLSKEKTPKEADAALKANILYFCEEHYEDILLVIMDKIRREKRKEVHARLDFEENTMKNRRVREDSQNSSAGTLRQSAFDRLSNTYSPTKSGLNEGNSRDRSHSRGRSPYKTLLAEIVLETKTAPVALKNHIVILAPPTRQGTGMDITLYPRMAALRPLYPSMLSGGICFLVFTSWDLAYEKFGKAADQDFGLLKVNSVPYGLVSISPAPELSTHDDPSVNSLHGSCGVSIIDASGGASSTFSTRKSPRI